MRTFFNPARIHQVCYAEKGEGDNIEGGYFLSSVNELDVEKKKAENLCPVATAKPPKKVKKGGKENESSN